jgi:hypothetical protein
VLILYRPSDPQSARVDDHRHLWGVPTITDLIGCFYLPVGLVVLFWTRLVGRFRRREAEQYPERRLNERLFNFSLSDIRSACGYLAALIFWINISIDLVQVRI